MSSRESVLCVIPARYGSTRLPGKPLLTINERPLVMWAYERAVQSGAFDRVVVATDDSRIHETVQGHGGESVMTRSDHASGTDRANEVVQGTNYGYVVNLQGDEPEIPSDLLKKFVARLQKLPTNSLLTCVAHATIEQKDDPNAVKVVMGAGKQALYFSRTSIPYVRGTHSAPPWVHIGLYGFPRPVLEAFCRLPRGELEQAEMLEQLRALEHGMSIYCMETEYRAHGIDTPEDLEAFRLRMQP